MVNLVQIFDEKYDFLRKLYDNSPIPLCCLSQSRQFLYCSESFLQFFNAKNILDCQKQWHSDAMLDSSTVTNSPNNVETLTFAIEQALKNGIAEFSCVHHTQTEEVIPVRYIITTITYSDEVIFVLQLHTQNVSLEEVESVANKVPEDIELRQALILDSMPIGVHFWDATGKLVYVNAEGISIFGFDSSEDALLNFDKIFPEYQPDGRTSLDVVKEQIKIAYEQDVLEASMQCVHFVTGEAIPIEISVVRTIFQGKPGLITFFKDMRQYNKILQENEEHEQKLQYSKELAERNAKAMGDFLANMSHEIRTPMNGILGLLHLLHLTNLNDTQKDYVLKIMNSSKNLMRIINDILDFSKIEAGKLEIEKQPFTLQGIGQEVSDLYRHTCTEKGLILDVSCSEHSDVPILGDALRLKQVVFNLISNAIKFTDSGGKILLEVESEVVEESELLCTFIISDTGIGLSPAQTEQLFSAFTQADSSVARKYGGTGLGLSISQSIIKLMDGVITVESKVGKGTAFSFSVVFPLHDESTWQSEQEEQMITESMDTTYAGHLLLVEDNEINQIVAQEILKAAGYTVHVAGHGQEALDLLDKNTYDLVLMDIQMPVMDGYTTTKIIRKKEKYAQLPIIAMSAHAMKGAKNISIDKGMNDHITKPIDPEELYATLRLWISK